MDDDLVNIEILNKGSGPDLAQVNPHVLPNTSITLTKPDQEPVTCFLNSGDSFV